MFDIGATELLLIAIVAILVIGPKDMPLALRTAGRWIGKVRRVSGHFKAGVESMIREAELEEMDQKWREQNEAIMAAHPTADDSDQMQPLASDAKAAEPSAESRARPENSRPKKAEAPPPAKAEIKTAAKPKSSTDADAAEPGLPFGNSQQSG